VKESSVSPSKQRYSSQSIECGCTYFIRYGFYKTKTISGNVDSLGFVKTVADEISATTVIKITTVSGLHTTLCFPGDGQTLIAVKQNRSYSSLRKEKLIQIMELCNTVEYIPCNG